MEGSKAIAEIINKKNSSKTLLQQTGIDKRIKLKDMKKTWEFTRTSSMLFRYIECLFYIIISCTDSLTYAAMIFSMYTNAGLITMFYPLAVFGYALLDEVRPKYQFWNTVMAYSMFVLVFKFIFSVEFFREIVLHGSVHYVVSLLKVGIVDYSTFGEMLAYFLPELLIIALLMLNEIKLKLLGLYW